MFNTYRILSSSMTCHVFSVHPLVVLLVFITFLVLMLLMLANNSSIAIIVHCVVVRDYHMFDVCHVVGVHHVVFPLLCLVLPLPLHCLISSWSFVEGRLLVVCDFALQEITTFFTMNFGQKNPPYDFFAPMFNLTKVTFWTSQFGFDHFD